MTTQAEQQNLAEKQYADQLQTGSGTTTSRNGSTNNVSQSWSPGYYGNADGIDAVTIGNQTFGDSFGDDFVGNPPNGTDNVNSRPWNASTTTRSIDSPRNDHENCNLDDSNMRYGSVSYDSNSGGPQVPRHTPIHNSIATSSGYVTTTDTAPLVYEDEEEYYGAPTVALGPENRLQEFPPRTARVNPFRVTSSENPATLDLENGDVTDWGVQPYHCHKPLPGVNRNARNKLIIVSVLCTIFMIAEIIGGAVSNSLALVTDAVHMASDLSSFIISIVAITLSTRAPSTRMSFGYHRAEIVGALASVLLIWVTTGVLLYLAIDRVINRHYDIEADMMLITAGLGLGFNIIMGVVLHGGFFNCNIPHGHSHGGHSHGGHGHSHSGAHSHGGAHSQGHSHGQNSNSSHSNFINSDNTNSPSVPTVSFSNERQRNRNNQSNSQTDSNRFSDSERSNLSGISPTSDHSSNINVRAAYIHVLGDIIQSVGVLIAAYIIRYKPDWKIVDPICTFLFSILVLCTTIRIIRDVGLILLEGVPKDFQYEDAKRDLAKLNGVEGVHSLHVWALTTDKHAVTAHLAVGANTDYDITVKSATTLLRDKYQAFTSVVQVESYDSALMTSCEQCKGPKES